MLLRYAESRTGGVSLRRDRERGNKMTTHHIYDVARGNGYEGTHVSGWWQAQLDKLESR